MAGINREKLEQEFHIHSRELVVAIAVRAAMRVLPVLASKPGFAYWSEDSCARHLQAIFTCYQTSAFISILTKEIKAEVWYAAGAARSAAADARSTADVCAATRSIADARSAAAAYAAARSAADARSAAHSADARSAADAIYAALEHDLKLAQSVTPSLSALHTLPLWPQGIPAEIKVLWQRFQVAALALNAGFEVWLDWYRDRLDGKPFDFDIERQWALLSEERRAQSPAEINAYLASLRSGSASKQLHRVRAIFIGHGEAGKTSLIKALHGKEVIEGKEKMTPGVDIQDARMAEEAGVFTQATNFNDDDLTVHFWDFGGQVMAHATHQFFLRANCLYVIVLDARPERNANEEAEYWLEHVRAFGDNAPVLIVGNKSDKMQVNLDLRSLKQKYTNIADFYPVSCTKAQSDKKAEFDRFSRDFKRHLTSLGERAERFTPVQFKVLKEVQARAKRDDFLSENDFDKLCQSSGLATEGYGGRDWLLKFFDTLGVVLHFPNLPFLTDYVLNPRWLTYGVYTIMYSEAAKKAGGRISEGDLVQILKTANAHDGNLALRFPADRCRLIADAMVAFRVAYRLANTTDRMVIPALLEAQQPPHNFDGADALAFRFDFKGFLPRHVLPALIVEHHPDIATYEGNEIVWQNGVLLRPGFGNDARALVKADYHERNIEILVRGSDAAAYLGILRGSILRTLQTMPELRFDENVMVRPDMRVEGSDLDILRDASAWVSYQSVRTAQKRKHIEIAVGENVYDLEKVLTAVPVPPEIQPADVFISYARENRAAVDRLAELLKTKGHSVWYDVNLGEGRRFRDVIRLRIDAAKAVVAVWTEHSIESDWVIWEASRANEQRKLICMRDPALDVRQIPPPFSANLQAIHLGKDDELLNAVKRLCEKGR